MDGIDLEDTIVAIASAPGPAVRGIVRVSGIQTIECISRIFQSDDGRSLLDQTSTTAISGNLKLRADHELIVDAELLLWPTEKSYTRQPTAEFHTIGSTPILQLIVKSVCDAGARLAAPGEFTLRAFLSGRIDLTQAEAVLAVIDSSGEKQLETALQQLAGGLAGPLGKIRDALMSTLAELEAGLDFVEEDIEFISSDELCDQLQSILEQLNGINSQIRRRDLATDFVKVVLIGLPNSGKSSLFNALTDSESAIVTNVAGTTTDFVTAELVIDSVQIELIDTAGFEESVHGISQQAQLLRTRQQEQSQICLLCIDGCRGLTEWEMDQLGRLSPASSECIVAITKSDLPDANQEALKTQIRDLGFTGRVITTSSVQRSGLDRLRDQIAVAILDSSLVDVSVVSTTVLRASDSLQAAIESTHHALTAAAGNLGEEIVAAEIRQALEGLGHVVGTVYTDDILDLVFGRFCIGK